MPSVFDSSGTSNSDGVEMYVTVIPSMLCLRMPVGQAPSFPFDADSAWAPSARAGLQWLLEAQRIPKGAEILMPTLICRSVADAVRQVGYVPALHKVPMDLQCSLQDIAPYVTPMTRALLLVHYFGFPQARTKEIVEFAHRSGLAVIEDCAHALGGVLQGRQVGTFGDAAIFSPYKILGGPMCGLVRPSAGSVAPPGSTWKGSPWDAIRQVAGLVLDWSSARLGVRPQSLTVPLKSLRPLPKPQGTHSLRTHVGPARWQETIPLGHVRRYVRFVDMERVARRRARNHALLREALRGESGLREVFPGPIDGLCPFVVPFWVDKDAERLRNRLRQHGILTPVWPELPAGALRSEFAGATELRARIVRIPVHQGISPDVIGRMSHIIARLNRVL